MVCLYISCQCARILRHLITHRICFTTQEHDPLLDLPLRRVEAVEESNNILRLLAIDPICVGIVG